MGTWDALKVGFAVARLGVLGFRVYGNVEHDLGPFWGVQGSDRVFRV